MIQDLLLLDLKRKIELISVIFKMLDSIEIFKLWFQLYTE